MAIAANAWVQKSGSATIRLWSSLGWTDNFWNLMGSSTDVPGEEWVNLYSNWRQSGFGTIDGNYLNIQLAACPAGDFILSTQYGEKKFRLIDGNITVIGELVGYNGFLRLAPEWQIFDPYPEKSLIYFGSDSLSYRGEQTAQLQKDGQIHAVVRGSAVDRVFNQSDEYWAPAAMVFYKFFWFIVPQEPTVYDFVFQEKFRQSTGPTVSHKVEMDLTEIYSPIGSQVFNVGPNDIFSIAMGAGKF